MGKRIGALTGAALLLLTLLLSACKSDDPPASDGGESGVSTESTGGFIDVGDPFGTTAEQTGSSENATGTTTGQGGKTTTKGNPKTTTTKGTTKTTKKSEPLPTGTSKQLDSNKDYFVDAAGRMPKKDLKDKTITIMSHTTFTPSPLMLAAYPGFQIKNVVVNHELRVTKFVAAVNSGDAPDLFWSDFNSQLIAKQYVKPMDSYIDYSDKMWDELRSSLDIWKVGGKHYYTFADGYRNDVVLYNKAMFKAKKLTEPAELFKSGQWNWDKLGQLTKQLTIDDNNDGTPEQYGLSVNTGPQAFIYTTGTDYIRFKNGKPENRLLSAELTRGMNYYIKLNKENKLYTDADMIEAFRQGKIAMLVTAKWVALTMADKIWSGNYMYTTLPRDPSADAHYVSYETSGFYLAKGAKNPEGAAAFLLTQRFSATDDKLGKAVEADELKEKIGLPKEARDMDALIKEKTKPVQLCWSFLDITQYVGDINARCLTESWSKIAAELSPKFDNAIKAYNNNTSA